MRRQHQAFGRGTFRLLYPKNRKVLAYLREYEGATMLCVANLARTPQAVELELSEFAGRMPIELDGGSVFPPIGQLTYLLTLPPYGFYWFLLADEEAGWPSCHTPAPEPMPEYQTIVLRDSPGRCIADGAPVVGARRPAGLSRQAPLVRDEGPGAAGGAACLAGRRADMPSRNCCWPRSRPRRTAATARWLLPLAIAWEDRPTGPLPAQLALARVRRGARVSDC